MKYIGRIEKDISLCEKNEKMVVFGAGKGLKRLLDKLEQLQIKDRVVCICDNNPEKQEKKISGIRVVSLDYALKNYRYENYIVYNQFCVEICRQLISNGVQKIHLIRS